MIRSGVVDYELLFEIRKGVELVRNVEFLIILAVTVLHLAIVLRGKRLDQFVPDTKLHKYFLKQRQRLFAAVAQAIGKFKTIVRLNTFNGIGEFLHHMKKELRGRIGAVLLKGFEIAKSAVFTDVRCIGSISVQPLRLPGSRHIFHIDLHPLSRILYLLICL